MVYSSTRFELLKIQTDLVGQVAGVGHQDHNEIYVLEEESILSMIKVDHRKEKGNFSA